MKNPAGQWHATEAQYVEDPIRDGVWVEVEFAKDPTFVPPARVDRDELEDRNPRVLVLSQPWPYDTGGTHPDAGVERALEMAERIAGLLNDDYGFPPYVTPTAVAGLAEAFHGAGIRCKPFTWDCDRSSHPSDAQRVLNALGAGWTLERSR